MERILVIADTHCGHVVGLTHPKFQIKFLDSEHYDVKQAKLREELWLWFADAIKKNGPYTRVIFNGDAIDGRGERSGGTELLTTDRNKQVLMAVEVLKFINCKEIYMTYGTPYHVSSNGEDYEYNLAIQIGAQKIEAEGYYDVEGLIITAKHYIGNSSSAPSAMTALRSTQLGKILWSLREFQKRENLIIRSHIHRCYNIGEADINFQAWVTPGLQGLGSKYGSRQCNGLPISFGFLIVEVRNVNDWCVRPVTAKLSMQSSEITKFRSIKKK